MLDFKKGKAWYQNFIHKFDAFLISRNIVEIKIKLVSIPPNHKKSGRDVEEYDSYYLITLSDDMELFLKAKSDIKYKGVRIEIFTLRMSGNIDSKRKQFSVILPNNRYYYDLPKGGKEYPIDNLEPFLKKLEAIKK